MSDELKQATESLRTLLVECDAALKRAEAAEAEVARLKAPLEQRPAWPYTPRVGDVVLFDGEHAEYAESLPRIVTKVAGDAWTCVHLDDGKFFRGPFVLSVQRNKVRLHRPATPAERAAAGLPVEPAKPEVLPEHLAWIEADAAWADSSWSTNFDSAENKRRHDAAIVAAKALNAAVARRDGGVK